MSSPFSYIYFTFTSNDTNTPHDVQLYSDVSGGMISTHYDERKLSAAAIETVRRGSVGTVTVKGVTGGIDRGEPVPALRRFSVKPADEHHETTTQDFGKTG